MGKRGPKPKPTALKIASGVRSDRINQAEPGLIEGDPIPPDDLDTVAKAEWERIIPILRGMGVLSFGDGAAIAVYCQAHSRKRLAEAEIRNTALVIEDNFGRQFVNPHVAIADKATEVMRRFFNEFGLTPSARSSIKVDPGVAAGADDEIDQFLRQKKAN